jgi:hypothetical protein
MNKEGIIEDFIEIEPLTNDDFLKVKETLTRIGMASRKDLQEGEKPILWQSVHVFHKKGRYFIVHFKQLFLLDGKTSKTVFTNEDYYRTNIVASLLQRWGLVKVKSPLEMPDYDVKVTIIPHKDKGNWDLRTKYSIGGNKNATSGSN